MGILFIKLVRAGGRKGETSKQRREKIVEKFIAGLLYKTRYIASDLLRGSAQSIVRKWKEFGLAAKPIWMFKRAMVTVDEM